MKTAARVKRVSSKQELKKVFEIRLRVFVREQGVPEEIELDHDDKRACHFLALDAAKAIGTARIVMRHGSAKIGRMAVLKSYRGRGFGRKLLKRAIGAARRQGAQKIYLHAQIPVIGFYEGMGFRCVGPVFKEAGIPHRKMVLPRIGTKGQGARSKKRGQKYYFPKAKRSSSSEKLGDRVPFRLGSANSNEIRENNTNRLAKSATEISFIKAFLSLRLCTLN